MVRSRKSQGWVAKHDDQAIPESVQRRILERQMNAEKLIICPDCGNPIRPGQRKAFDHAVPLIDGGEHSEENLRAIHENPCHAIKTKAEAKARTKARSQFAAVHGIKKAVTSPLAGARIKYSRARGCWVDRLTGETVEVQS